MDWLIPFLYILAITEASLLGEIGKAFGGLLGYKECKLKPGSCSTDEIRCGPRPKKPNKDPYYRPIDGTCNNQKYCWWGTPLTPYVRLLENNYYDGEYEFAKTKDNKDLPNVREISLQIYSSKDVDDLLWTLSFMQYLQIITHDLSETSDVIHAPAAKQCCKGKPTDLEKTDSRCASIYIPECDKVNKKAGIKCMNFYRTESTKDRDDCEGASNVGEPLTDVTGFIDASYIYGSDAEVAKSLREHKGGRLRTAKRNGFEYLPQVPNPKEVCDFFIKPKYPSCYLAGDQRVNQNPGLSLVQILYLLHHNKIADDLAELNPHWDDEKIYQETRKIVIAVHQYIFYYEMLLFILGSTILVNQKIIYPGARDFINDYDPTVNPGTSNEFATAGFRVFHTLVKSQLNIYGNNTIFSKEDVRLKDWMNNPGIVEGKNFLGFIRGLATQASDALDAYITEDIHNYLFLQKIDGHEVGSDLKAIDLMRGRDHGLGTYAQAIVKCCLGDEPETFEDLLRYIDKQYVDILKKLYKSPLDVELHVGISLEKRLPATLCGPVSGCLIADQALRSRTGDRFFFENNIHPSAFTKEQLNSIRDTSRFAIFPCLVPGIEKIQMKAFQQVSLTNPLVPCSSLPQLDLSLWKDNPKKKKKNKKDNDECS